jgi:hypothetical protein
MRGVIILYRFLVISTLSQSVCENEIFCFCIALHSLVIDSHLSYKLNSLLQNSLPKKVSELAVIPS